MTAAMVEVLLQAIPKNDVTYRKLRLLSLDFTASLMMVNSVTDSTAKRKDYVTIGHLVLANNKIRDIRLRRWSGRM